MKRNFLIILIILLLPLVVLPLLSAQLPPSSLCSATSLGDGGCIAGRIRIPVRRISAEIYTRGAEPIDGMSSLWHGGKVTVKEDLSSVQLYDMAEIYTVEGEHLVLECVSITGVPAWLQKTDGDVLVVNGRWVYRFIRL